MLIVMNKLKKIYVDNLLVFNVATLALVFLYSIMLYKLGSLTAGYSATEYKTATSTLGFNGFFYHIFYLPLEAIRSILFFIFKDHGYTITRLPNVIIGSLTVIIYSWIIYNWHGKRTAFLSFLLFTCSAWTLHVSRLASYDVMYAFTGIALIGLYVMLKKYKTSYSALLLNAFAISMIITIPGMIWLAITTMILTREEIKINWNHINKLWKKLLVIIVWFSSLPLIVYSIFKYGGFIKFVGLPEHFAGVTQTIKNVVGVPVHLFVRGPQMPEIWLAQAAILDILVLIACLVGILFYVTHKEASRSRFLLIISLVSLLLVMLGGAVSISLLIPLLYVYAATGIAYLSREWLVTFPVNPFARTLGVSLISIGVGLSCIYGIRSYFVAWPHNQITTSTFVYKIK